MVARIEDRRAPSDRDGVAAADRDMEDRGTSSPGRDIPCGEDRQGSGDERGYVINLGEEDG